MARQAEHDTAHDTPAQNGRSEAQNTPTKEDDPAASPGLHGRDADKPREIPKRGWWDVLKRVWADNKKNNLSLVAAGVAFYGMLAIFPAIVAMVTVYALVSDPDQVRDQVKPVTDALPPEAAKLLVDQLTAATNSSGGGLTIGLVASLLGVLWSASGGVQALITGLNVVYGEDEERGFFKLKALSLLLTFGALVASAVALGLVALFPALLSKVGLGGAASLGANVARWALLVVLVSVSLAIVYRYGPDRANPRWRWTSWGAGVALVLWVAGSVAFSVYVSQFGSYNKTYGTLAAVIILMLWLFLTAYVILLGAQLNAELEHQTAKDTTAGRGEPMGRRDAEMADSLGAGPDTDDESVRGREAERRVDPAT